MLATMPIIHEAHAERFALASGLFTSLVIRGVSVSRLAALYGLSEASLRARLRDHLATCAAALGEEPAALPQAPAVRVRERVQPAVAA